jgi:hypothetical protein
MSEPRLEFSTRSAPDFVGANFTHCEILFYGDVVDDRGKEAISNLKDKADVAVQVGFLPGKNELLIDGKAQPFSELTAICRGKNAIRVETTTLGFAEILRIIQAAKGVGICRLEFVYIEPKEYTIYSGAGAEFLNPREFELTENHVFTSLHGFAFQKGAVTSEHYIFFLGFESSRLMQAFEQNASSINNKCCVIGIPPFVSGWETNSLASNACDLKTLGFSGGSILYCAANSTREAYLLLWDIYKKLRSEKGTFVVTPLGTKPHSLASALFLVETKGDSYPTALYYDHPVRKKGRSRELRTWHIYAVNGLS